MRLDFFINKSPIIDFSFFPNVFNNPKKVLEILKKNPISPVFFVDVSIIKNRLELINKSLKNFCPKNPCFVAYSFKTNYDISQKVPFQMAEVVSRIELKKALKQEYQYSSIIFNGPNKGDLTNLLQYPITINLDNFSELNKIISYKNNIKAKIGIRINTDLFSSRFGFNLESGEASKAISLLENRGVPLSGLHIHIGSDIHKPQLYKKYSLILKKFINNNIFFYKKLKYIDFGGGYPSHSMIPGTSRQSVPDINEYIKSIVNPLISILDKDTALILEPGRFLVDDSTVLISKVIDIKIKNNIQTIILNSTINMLPTAWYHKLIIKTYNSNFVYRKNNRLLIDTNVYGCTCQESDRIYQGKLPLLRSGDYVVFFCVGAYNQSQTSSFIFKKPKSIFI